MRVNRQSDPRWRWAGAVAAVVTLLSFAAVSPGVPAGTLPASLLMPMSGFVPDEAIAAYADPEHLAAVPAGPGKVAQPVAGVLSATRVVDTLGESGIPEVALRAYKQAAARVSASCGLSWTVLAAIGRVESDHGRFGGTSLRADGTGTMRIRGIPLDGRANVVLIRDTDGGALDGDTVYDRAVGPMQFIPSTWGLVMADGNNDGRADVHNIYDAALGAARYLCAGSANLRDQARLAQAIRRYNNADSYVRVVLNLARRYATGTVLTIPTDPARPFNPTTGDPSGDRRLALRSPGIPWPSDRAADDPATDDTRTRPSSPTRTAPPVRLVPATPIPPLATTPAPTRPPSAKPSTPPKPPRPAITPPPSRPTSAPTSRPTSVPPTSEPTTGPPPSPPTADPTTAQPTSDPTTDQPTSTPSTSQPTVAPTTTEPTTSPSDHPTAGPATPTPTGFPAPPAGEAPDTAAVGWAPAMRQQVVRILKSATPKTAASPALPKPSQPSIKPSSPSTEMSRPSGKPSPPSTKQAPSAS